MTIFVPFEHGGVYGTATIKSCWEPSSKVHEKYKNGMGFIPGKSGSPRLRFFIIVAFFWPGVGWDFLGLAVLPFGAASYIGGRLRWARGRFV